MVGAENLLACFSLEAMNISHQVAYYTAAFASVAIATAMFVEWRRGAFAWTAIYAALLALHPAWPLVCGEILSGSRAVNSDCGYGDRFFSVVILIATLSVLFVVLFRPAFSRRLFLGTVAVACWMIHISAWLLLRVIFLPLWLPAEWSAGTVVQEAIAAIEFGEARLGRFTVILTLICAALYIPWERLGKRVRHPGSGQKVANRAR